MNLRERIKNGFKDKRPPKDKKASNYPSEHQN